MNFFSFDFETANSKRSSACAIGITAVKHNQVTHNIHQLINPHEEFQSFTTNIHGITAEMVQDKPDFGTIWPEIAPIFAPNHLLIAHNLSFDVSVLRQTLAKYQLPMPTFLALDTVKTAKHFYPNLPNHKLNTIAEYLELELDHHNASSDSLVCAQILLHQAQNYGTTALKPFVKQIEK